MFETYPTTDEEWRQRLTPEQYSVLRKHWNRAPVPGPYLESKEDGTYRCAGCGNPLFESGTKFESGTGGRVSPKRSRAPSR
jgi:peptide-methionine (R)-S-oxide reductase